MWEHFSPFVQPPKLRANISQHVTIWQRCTLNTCVFNANVCACRVVSRHAFPSKYCSLFAVWPLACFQRILCVCLQRAGLPPIYHWHEMMHIDAVTKRSALPPHIVTSCRQCSARQFACTHVGGFLYVGRVVDVNGKRVLERRVILNSDRSLHCCAS